MKGQQVTLAASRLEINLCTGTKTTCSKSKYNTWQKDQTYQVHCYMSISANMYCGCKERNLRQRRHRSVQARGCRRSVGRVPSSWSRSRHGWSGRQAASSATSTRRRAVWRTGRGATDGCSCGRSCTLCRPHTTRRSSRGTAAWPPSVPRTGPRSQSYPLPPLRRSTSHSELSLYNGSNIFVTVFTCLLAALSKAGRPYCLCRVYV